MKNTILNVSLTQTYGQINPVKMAIPVILPALKIANGKVTEFPLLEKAIGQKEPGIKIKLRKK